MDDVEERLARFAPAELTADLSGLSAEDRRTLGPLVAAAREMDEIFIRQVAAGNAELRDEIAGWSGPRAAAVQAYFDLHFGPWDRSEELEPFVGEEAHPPGAGYYPSDLSREELESWIATHPESAEAMRSLVTVVRRQGGELVAVPYSTEYRRWLVPAAEHLREAAAMTPHPSLSRYLELRAAAFLNDDYYDSDLAWMDLESPVEITIGPYETYEDGLMGFKGAFEAFVTVVLPRESQSLERFKSKLPWLESNLPIPDEHKNQNRGTQSPIRVADLVFSAGDTKAGVQTLAFNLPNDERVREAKGSKKVLLRNVMRAKFERILLPIAERVLAADQVAQVSFDAFFQEILQHELAHGLGPGKIEVGGEETEVKLQLKELYTTLEEAKADVMGVYNILALIEEGEIPAELRESLEPTYVAGLFRAARFGVHEAHGRGVVAQFNYLHERRALEVDEEGRYRAVSEALPAAIRDLLRDLLMLQARGDYEGTAAFLEEYGRPSESLLAAIDRLDDVPVDIRPIYPQAGGTAALGE